MKTLYLKIPIISGAVNLLIIASLFSTHALSQTEQNDGITERETYNPVVERDRTTRYKVDKHGYKLKEEDIGNHVLSVRVKEKMAEGSERIHDVADFTLDVQPEGNCEPPALEVLHPQQGDVLYDLLSGLTMSSLSSSINLEGTTAHDTSSGSPEHFIAAYYFLTVTTTEYINFELSMPSTNDSGSVLIFQDDGDLDASDLVESLIFYGYSGDGDGDGPVGQAGDNEYTNILAGDYIIAVTAEQIYSGDNDVDNIANRQAYNCYSCNSEEDIYFTLNIRNENPILRAQIEPNLPPDYEPISIKASAPSGISSVVLGVSNEQIQLETNDDVIYKLDHTEPDALDFYRNNLFTELAPTEITLTATAVCGINSSITTPLNIQADPIPAATINITTNEDFELNYGEQTHIPIALDDAGRNIQEVHAVLYEIGTIPTGDAITLGGYEDFIAGKIGEYFFFNDITKAKPLSLNDFNFQLPVYALYYKAPVGDFELRLLTFDSLGQGSASEPVAIRILPPAVPPFLDIGLFDFRIPPGQEGVLYIDVEHLGPLDRLEIQAVGAAVDQSVRVIPLHGDIYAEVDEYIQIAPSALPGQTVDLTITAIGDGGQTSSMMLQIEVGDWGERTIQLDQFGNIRSTDEMRYANIVIGDGTHFVHNDLDIRFNSVHIQSGGIFQTGYNGSSEDNLLDLLELEDTLQIDSGGELRVPTIRQNKRSDGLGGMHGGDSNLGPAYGNFREPRFPGARGNIYNYSGGGKLQILVPNLVIDGVINVDGENRNSSSGTPQLGAGGSLLINTETVSGSGKISANGGGFTQCCFNQHSGAGGRIAIYYDQYANGTLELMDGLDVQTYPGNTNPGYYGGAGTVFLQRTDQVYGELIINAQADFDGNQSTTIPSVGRHVIQAVDNQQNNQYRITVNNSPWKTPDPTTWEAGLVGMHVSLNANDENAPLYTIIDNDETSFIIESNIDLSGLVGNELTGVIRLNTLRTGNNIRLRSNDRLYATNYEVTNINTLDDVIEIQSDTVFNLDDYIPLESTLLIGDVNTNSIRSSNDTVMLSSDGITGIDPTKLPKLNISSLNSCVSGRLLRRGSTCSVVWYDLSLPVATTITLTMNIYSGRYSYDRKPHMRIFDANNFTANGQLAAIGQNQEGPMVLEQALPAGNYIVVTARNGLSTADALSGIDTNYGSSISYSYFTLSVAADRFGTDIAINCPAGQLAAIGEPCSVVWYEFSVNQSSHVNIAVNSTAFIPQFYLINANNFTSSGLLASSTNGVLESNVEPGAYVIAIGEGSLTASEALLGINNGGTGAGGAFTLSNISQPFVTVSITGDFTVNNDVDLIRDSLIVKESLSANSVNLAEEASITVSSLSVTDNLTIQDASTLNTESAIIGGSVNITNNSSWASADLSITSDLTILDDSSLNTESASIGGSVNISNNSTWMATDNVNIENMLNINYGLLSVLGTLTINGNTSLLNNARLTAVNANLQNLYMDPAIMNISERLVAEGDVDLQNAAQLTAADGDVRTLTLNNSDFTINNLLTASMGISVLNNADISANRVSVLNNSNFVMSDRTIVRINDLLDVSGALTGEIGARLSARRIQAGNIQFDGLLNTVTLYSEEVNSASDILLNRTNVFAFRQVSPAIIPVPAVNLIAEQGTLVLSSDSKIDVNNIASTITHASQYPECSPSILPQGSYGGAAVFNNTLTADCAYGRYDIAEYPGSPFDFYLAGGVAVINAQSATLDGTITANATSRAAGGSIKVLSDQLSGSGTLQAIGSKYGSWSGGGGRIMIQVDTIIGTDIITNTTAHGGLGAGAGTVLIADRNLNNKHLIIDNTGSSIAPIDSTPIRSVGRHLISAVNLLSADTWEIEISEAIWKSSSSINDLGLAGHIVSLNADDPDAQLYVISSNTESTLIIETSDALDTIVTPLTDELIGVHSLETLTVTGGAFADFGDDRVIVNDLINSNVDAGRITASPDSILPQ